MPDQEELIIPDSVREQFPTLVPLIVKSESMNDDERQYWVNILPIMTPEQREDLQQILAKERDQLQAIDQKYAHEVQELGQKELVEKTEQQRRKRRQQRESKEEQVEQQEDDALQDVLNKIEDL